MLIYLGADHRGFQLKESLKKYLIENNYQVVDLGNEKYDENDDYPDWATEVSRKITETDAERRGTENKAGQNEEERGITQKEGEEARGIVICRSGIGVNIVANKFKGVRCALVTDIKQAELSRYDDDTNVLALSAELTGEDQAKKIVDVWLSTLFSGLEKDIRRIGKIGEIESGIMKGE